LAESLLEEAEAAAKELGEDYGRAVVLLPLGELALGRGHYGVAEELLQQALDLFRKLPSPGGVDTTLTLLGKAAYAKGDRARAHHDIEEVEEASGSATVVEVLQLKGELAVEEGDPNEGRRLFEKARDTAYRVGCKQGMAQALHRLGHLARDSGNTARAAALHHEALELQRQICVAPAIVASLEAIAGLAAVAGRHTHAARVLGAAQALRDAHGYARAPQDSARLEADIALIHEAHSAEEFEAGFAQGADLSMDEVMAQVLRGRGRRGRPSSGWSSLTDAQRQVAELVAQGLSNREIAERLFITPGTVKNHVSRSLSKLGLRGRMALAREVRRRQQRSVAPD
jgi:DNA-binding CsgD family transcriptional regulator/tetratricopeptide (TPR) repeat protein